MLFVSLEGKSALGAATLKRQNLLYRESKFFPQREASYEKLKMEVTIGISLLG